ncbi:MAG: PilZ domain-containing protein [Candidatus Omnitrophica bacterium]|nr:PilZ domain-containing protein [Candidatus Omnitrophota bacterium]HOX54159.1 PilZ domain-containing protein [Candidatus Omnitrophota bacterium]
MFGRGNNLNERRKFVRFNSSVDVQYALLDKDPNLALQGKSRNISSGGIGLITDKKLQEDDVLVVSIYMPQETLPIIAKSKVVWVRPLEMHKEKRFDVGSEFINIAPEDRKKIDRYLFSLRKS